MMIVALAVPYASLYWLFKIITHFLFNYASQLRFFFFYNDGLTRTSFLPPYGTPNHGCLKYSMESNLGLL
jgi:hypothetical protein